MTTRGPQSQVKHDQLVYILARHFQSLGYVDVKADHKDYQTPNLITLDGISHIPDITCYKSENGVLKFIVAEAETCDTMPKENPHTQEQWQAFNQYVGKIGGEFHVIVPEECYAEAAQWGSFTKSWWV